MTELENTRRQVVDTDEQYREIRKRDQQRNPDTSLFSFFSANAHNAKKEKRDYLQRRIAELSQTHTDLQEQAQNFHMDINSALHGIKQEMDDAQFDLNMISLGEPKLRDTFYKLGTDILNICSKKTDDDSNIQREEYVVQQLVDILKTPEMYTAVMERVPVSDDALNIQDIAYAFQDPTFPIDAFIEAAKEYNERIEKQKEQLDLFVEQTKSEFIQALQQGVKDGWLPETILANIHRLEDIRVILDDKMSSLLDNIEGSHSPEGTLSVSNEDLTHNDLNALRQKLFHEMLHEIAGLSVNLSLDTEGRLQIDQRKSGVQVSSERFSWLNEAITEWLALRLSKYDGDTSTFAYKGSRGYPRERYELDSLFEKGLEEDIVIRAYFENFRSDERANPKQYEGKGQYFRKLVERINQIEGPGGFLRLDNEFLLKKANRIISADSNMFRGDVIAQHPEKLQGYTIYYVDLVVGLTEATRVEQRYSFLIDSQSDRMTPEDQVQQLQQKLSDLKKQMDRRFSFSIKEAQKPNF